MSVFPPSRRVAYPVALAVLLVVWATGMTVSGMWPLFAEHWPMPVTMIFGSFVAGSTPAGGGAVAFPVFTKILHIDPGEARTFSLMIQSVGMTMAALFIFSWRIPIYKAAYLWSLPGGLAGMTLGTWWDDAFPNPYPRLVFTMVVGTFGATVIIGHWFLKFRPTLEEKFHLHSLRSRGLFILASFIGGAVASQIGSGIDMIVFTLMSLAFGLHERRAIPTSVVLMATLSVYGFFLRALPVVTPPIGPVWHYWLVCVPIVAVGAPLGSFVASKMNREVFLAGILLLIVAECVSTVLLIPLGRVEAWVMGLTFILTALCFWGMIRFRQKRLGKEEPPARWRFP